MQTMTKRSGMMPPPGMDPNGSPMGGGGGGGGEGGAPTETSDTQFEKTFADLAFAHLKDKAPKLLDHMVGFQVIDKDEDTRGVGVFGFEVGNQWLMAPSFFLNGELKGYELLYIKDQDTFVPLEENWVNYILDRKPAMLGSGTAYSQRDLSLGQPDLSVFSRSPLTFSKSSSLDTALGKYGEGKPFDINVCRSWFAITPNGETFKKVAARNTLPEMLKVMGKPMVDCLLNTMKQDEKFAAAVMKFYDVRDLLIDFEKEAAKGVRGLRDGTGPFANSAREVGLRRAAGEICPVGELTDSGEKKKSKKKPGVRTGEGPGVGVGRRQAAGETCPAGLPIEKTAGVEVSGESSIEDLDMPIDSEQIETVEIVRVDDPGHIRKTGLTENEKIELKSDGILIKDHRNDTSKVYNLQEPASLFNPSDTGIYEVLVQPKEFRKMIFICRPYTIGKGSASCCVCIDSENKGWVNGNTKSFYVRKQMEPSEWQKFYDGLPSVSNLTEDGTYVIVGPKGEGTIPFTVVKRVSNEDTTDFYVDPRTYVSRADALAPSPLKSSVDRAPGMKPEIHHEHDEIKVRLRRKRKETKPTYRELDEDGYSSHEYTEYCRHICITSMEGEEGTLRNVGNTLMCPSSMKVIKLDKKHDDLGYTPATLADIQLALIKSGAVNRMKLWSNGSTFQIQGSSKKIAGGISEPMGRFDAIESLVLQHGVTGKDARDMVKSAKVGGSTEYLIKYAGNLIPGPDAPAMDNGEGEQGYDDMMRARVIEPSFRQLPIQRSYEGNAEMYKPLDDSTRQMASEAGRTGQKEVFDTSVLGGLVKKMDLDSAIDRYLGDLIIGLDRLGRILFMFYWHQDKFKERYGQEELRELEDSLKNTFKSVGDVVLFLKKRTVEPASSMQGADVNLDY